MDRIRKRTILVGIATLILGLVVGLGIGIWGVHTSHASNAAPALTASTASPAPNDRHDSANNRIQDWDPFGRMEQMQEEIDRAIRKATEQFELGKSATVFRPDAGYSSSFDLHDRKDHFELRAYLPDAEASDVNVKMDDDKTLHVTVNHKKQEMKKDSAHEASVTELGEYEQIITLPEPVRSADMKIQRNGHEVIITIPKANKNT
jgi:HSP20 family molecular chaperone IbpA